MKFRIHAFFVRYHQNRTRWCIQSAEKLFGSSCKEIITIKTREARKHVSARGDISQEILNRKYSLPRDFFRKAGHGKGDALCAACPICSREGVWYDLVSPGTVRIGNNKLSVERSIIRAICTPISSHFVSFLGDHDPQQQQLFAVATAQALFSWLDVALNPARARSTIGRWVSAEACESCYQQHSLWATLLAANANPHPSLHGTSVGGVMLSVCGFFLSFLFSSFRSCFSASLLSVLVLINFRDYYYRHQVLCALRAVKLPIHWGCWQ